MQLSTIIKKLFSKPLLLLLITYFLVSFYLFQTYGVKVVNDSERYLTYARNLQAGFYFDAHNFWYFTYSLFIYCIFLFTENPFWIIIAQYVVSFLSIIALYKTYKLVFEDKLGACLSALLYILFIEVVAWNSYILCESLYCSLTCFSLYRLVKLLKTPNSFLDLGLTALIVLLTIFTKPSGIALLGALVLTLITLQWKKINSKQLKIGLALVLSIAFILLINQMLTTFLLIENYSTGDIIYAASSLPGLSSYHWLVIQVPKNIYIPPVELSPLVRLAAFITHNFWFWLQLFIAKILYFIFHIRPYWSLKHNVFVLTMLLPMYFFTGLHFMKHRLPFPVLFFSSTYILLHSLIVGVTSVDWDGRFLMPVLPLLFIIGIASVRKQFS